MKLDAQRIKKIYSGNVVRHYDKPISHMFSTYKKKAFYNSSLKKGDKVMVFCCGTGLDFPEIIKRIGEEGVIVGIDFSEEMLKRAAKRIQKNAWHNIKLINADVTQYQNDMGYLFDVGVCTLGMSIIPDYKEAYYNLLSFIKNNGEVIIGDAQYASNGYAWFNPILIFMAKSFGGSIEGHKNCLELYSIMNKELDDVVKKEYFMKTYFYCIGKKPS